MSSATRILVVDDEPDLEELIRMKFRRQIRRGEYDFCFAGNGLEALSQLENDDTIEIVLTDINMPQMDGLTLLERIADLERMVESIVISAYGDLPNIRTAMNRGAFDFLIKPIELNDLEITINKSRANVMRLKRAAMVRDTFGRYVSDEVVNELLDSSEALELGGQRRTVTMLMSDIRGFSAISQTLPPETVVDMLNVYLGRMTEIITRYGGTINEFIGDAIFVLFGAPIQHEDDAARAVACALEMQQAMDEVNEKLRSHELPVLEMGIGINTGDVVVGNIGSKHRMKYAAVGSHVNLTARIESYTVGGQILISEGTLQAVPNAKVSGDMQVQAKGFSAPIPIHDVRGIGAPYHFVLPLHEDTMVELEEPIASTFTVLDGKHVDGGQFTATIERLSSAAAVVHTDVALHLFDNLKIELPALDGTDDHLGDLYAKVIETGPADMRWLLRFTAVPQDVGTAIRARCARS